MKDEPIDVEDGQGPSAESSTIQCRTHRQVSDLKWPNVIAEVGMIGTKFPEIAEHLGNQLLSCTWSADDLTSDEGTSQSNAIIG
jgi:hypothetical protein